MYEKRNQRPVPIETLFKRIGGNFLIGAVLIALSVYGGMWGYHHFTGMSWVDAFLNASMILAGMGPVDTLKTDGAKLFAGFYALFSGIIFLVIIALIFAPIFHYLFHHFHFVDEDIKDES